MLVSLLLIIKISLFVVVFFIKKKPQTNTQGSYIRNRYALKNASWVHWETFIINPSARDNVIFFVCDTVQQHIFVRKRVTVVAALATAFCCAIYECDEIDGDDEDCGIEGKDDDAGEKPCNDHNIHHLQILQTL